jgi:DDE superfamily endonuclease
MNYDLISISSEDDIISVDSDKNVIKTPKKIVRRAKKSFPSKRNNYKKYQNASWKWCDILKEIDLMKENKNNKIFKTTATKYNICRSTLVDKYRKWVKNGRLDCVNSEGRGVKTYFSIEEERTLYENINNVYIKNDLFFDDQCLKILALKEWKYLYPNDVDKFKASNGWIYEFKMKWGLSSFIARKTKKANECSENIVINFQNECLEAYQNYGPALLFNLDETFYRLLNGPIYSIGITGSDHRNVITGCDDKNGFTTVFLISANGSFHKPIVIMKGKTERCLAKTMMIDNTNIILKYSESGWISCDILESILEYIYQLAGGQKCALILDSYGVHEDEKIREIANKLKINLIYVPSGRTAFNQPLDISVNGIIKAISGKLIREKYMTNPLEQIKISDAIQCMLNAKIEVKSQVIKDAFTKACNL